MKTTFHRIHAHSETERLAARWRLQIWLIIAAAAITYTLLAS